MSCRYLHAAVSPLAILFRHRFRCWRFDAAFSDTLIYCRLRAAMLTRFTRAPLMLSAMLLIRHATILMMPLRYARVDARLA